MNRHICLVIAFLFASSSFGGEIKFLGFTNNWWSNFEITAGLCSYKETSNRLDNNDGVDVASYIQFPVVQYNSVRINAGYVMPSTEFRRSRPELSVSHLFGEDLSLPSEIPLEIGVYVAISPWEAWGIQFGLIRMEF